MSSGGMGARLGDPPSVFLSPFQTTGRGPTGTRPASTPREAVAEREHEEAEEEEGEECEEEAAPAAEQSPLETRQQRSEAASTAVF